MLEHVPTVNDKTKAREWSGKLRRVWSGAKLRAVHFNHHFQPVRRQEWDIELGPEWGTEQGM